MAKSLESIKSRIKVLEDQLKQKEERKRLESKLANLKRKVSEKREVPARKKSKGSFRQRIRGRLGTVADSIDQGIANFV